MVVAILGIFGFFTVNTLMKNMKAADYEKYTSDPGHIEEYNSAKTVVDKRDVMQSRYDELSQKHQDIATNNVISPSAVNEIEGCLTNAKLVSMNFDSTAMTCTLQLTTSSVNNIPSIISKLRAVGIFTNVDYSGYSNSDKTYSTTVTCQCRQ